MITKLLVRYVSRRLWLPTCVTNNGPLYVARIEGFRYWTWKACLKLGVPLHKPIQMNAM